MLEDHAEWSRGAHATTCQVSQGLRLWSPQSARCPIYVSSVAESNPVETTLLGAVGEVALLQAVADPVRWAVLDALAQDSRCVCDLQERVPIAGNLLSYHLKVLREAGLVTATRRGRWIDYALAEDAIERLRAALPGTRVAVG